MRTGERDYRLDLLRVIAMSMIVLMHSPMPNGAAPGFVLAGISYATAPGIGLFFMISGALLLGNSLTTREFLKRRFSKVLFPTLIWSLFYLALSSVKASVPAGELAQKVLSIPFSAVGQGVLWFMYTLVGLYLLTPILSRWLKSVSKHEFEFYLFLWGVTLVYPYLKVFLTINESPTGPLYYFAGYAGYFLLGYYLKEYYSFKRGHVVAAVAIALVVPALLYSSGREFDFYSMLWYLSLPVVSMAVCWFVLVRQLPNKKIPIIGEVSKLSFGIYLVHIFIMRDVVWKIDLISQMPGLVQILVIVVMTFALSLMAAWLISRLPFSKYIIGV